MSSQWVGHLTPKRIITFVVLSVVAIYVVWYVIEAVEGFDTTFKPSSLDASMDDDGSGSKTGVEFFDPTKTTPEVVPTK